MREMRSRGKFATVRFGEGKSESGRSKTMNTVAVVTYNCHTAAS